MRGAMSQPSRMDAGQKRKIVPDLSKQVQWLTRMSRMPRIIHKVFSVVDQGSPHIGSTVKTCKVRFA